MVLVILINRYLNYSSVSSATIWIFKFDFDSFISEFGTFIAT